MTRSTTRSTTSAKALVEGVVLAEYLVGCLDAYEKAVNKREGV